MFALPANILALASGSQRARVIVALVTIALVMMATMASAASAVTSPQPSFTIRSISEPTNLSLVTGGFIETLVTNTGAQSTGGGEFTITDALPAGLRVTSVEAKDVPGVSGITVNCSNTSVTVTCTATGRLEGVSRDGISLLIGVEPEAGVSGEPVNTATVEGEGIAATSHDVIPISSEAAPFGVSNFSIAATTATGASDTQAADHPNALTTSFDLTTATRLVRELRTEILPSQDLKDVSVDLPLGLVGDPQAAPTCSLTVIGDGSEGTDCPRASAIGTVALIRETPSWALSTSTSGGGLSEIYNIAPEHGYAAEFAFTVMGRPVIMYAQVVASPTGYRLRVSVQNISRTILARDVQLTFWGDPSVVDGVGTPAAAFLTLPANCGGGAPTARISADSWQNPGAFVSREATLTPLTGCDALQFQPTFTLSPETGEASAPSGLDAELSVPQDPQPAGLATPELKDLTVRLPPGMAINPASADGLQACADNEVGLENTEPSSCPPGSTIGTLTLHTPLLAETLEGRLFLGVPLCGPCSNADAASGRLVRLFLEVANPTRGIDIKLPGTATVDPSSGQVTASFPQNPQLPFDDLRLHLKSGPRAPLVTPQTCGPATTVTDMTPWSTPYTPDATPASSFTINQACGPRGFGPTFTAGSINDQANAFSPLAVGFSRSNQDQSLGQVQVQLPPGLIGILSSVPLCAEAQANAGTCPVGSQVGHVIVSAGAGSSPIFLPIAGHPQNPVYITGPYHGAPFGLAFVVPAIAGPFNLGTVVVRATISIDPHTARVTVTSDPLPQILDGIPLQIRSVTASIDRPGFMFNPTNCAVMAVDGTITSTQGTAAPVSSRFQAANCANLPFKPSFAASTQGHTSKANGASLTVKIAQKPGEANIHKVNLQLPISLPSRLTTLQKACTEAQFNANPAGCPEGSFVGTATAHTPVLNAPLTGPAILVSHGGAAFPDVEFVLQGEGVQIVLDGKTDIKKGRTYSNFETVPDAPISSFETVLPVGPHSVLGAYVPGSNHYNFCGQNLTLPTTITAQNGAVITQTTKLGVTGCPAAITVVRQRVKGKTATIQVRVPGAGKLVATAKGLSKASKTAKGATIVTLKLTLTNAEAVFLGKHRTRKLKAKVNLQFTPKKGGKLKTSTTVIVG
jgi:hypothetical protein